MEASWIALLPPLFAVVLAFLTRDAATSLAFACAGGVLLMGDGLEGIPALMLRALSQESFIWVCGIELCIGVLVAFFQRSGAVQLFTVRASQWARSRRQTATLGWGLGLFIFFSDYFSPLFVGPVMRNLTDKYRISREKIAYIADSTSAPLSILMPFSGWAAYLMGFVDAEHDAGALFLGSIPLNFYAYLSVLMVFVNVQGWLPDFGPMRAAERRTIETGRILREGAVPMMGGELTEIAPSSTAQPRLLLNFILPLLLIVVVNLASFWSRGKPAVLEGFMLSVSVLAAVMWLQGIDPWKDIIGYAYSGMKGVVPAIAILALAFCINTLSKDMQAAEYIISVTRPWMSAALLPFLLFLVSALISFSTGTSWGTYAIMMPIALPLAFELSGGEPSLVVLTAFAAVSGGGVFGDHVSPLSDTTVLSSLGSACDHMDHVRTQLPYALCVGGLASILYLILGCLVGID